MGPMKLYRVLQAHVGVINAVVIALYKEEITVEDALAQSIQMLEQALAALESDK